MLNTIHTQHRPLPHLSETARGDASPLLPALFGGYLIVLTWAIVWKLGVPYASAGFGPVKLVPFGASSGFGPSAPGEVAANFLVFVPYGVILAALLPKRTWTLSVWVIAGTSLTYELLQFVLGVGAADTTDVLVNTAGGVIGVALWMTARTRSRFGYRGVLSRAAVFGLLLSIVLGSAMVLFGDLL